MRSCNDLFCRVDVFAVLQGFLSLSGCADVSFRHWSHLGPCLADATHTRNGGGLEILRKFLGDCHNPRIPGNTRLLDL